MAEPVQLQAVMAADPTTGIKREHEPESSILDGIDFNMLAELASKRSFDDLGQDNDDDDQGSKRLKTETQTEEESLEDGLALLVQNALSNVSDLVDQFNVGSDAPTGNDPMDVDGAHGADARPAPVSFLSEPEKYVRIANTHALGNLPVDDMSKLARDADSGYGRSYGRLKRSFDATWQLFSDGPVLSADDLEIQEAEPRTSIELANLAQFGSWLIEDGLGSFAAAEQHFPSIFQCQLPDLPTGTMELYVGVKTQTTIESLLKKELGQQAEDVVRASFIEGLEGPLGAAYSGTELSSTAQELVSLVQSRRDALIGDIRAGREGSLKDMYPAGDVLRSFEAYVRTKLASLTELGEKLGISALLSDVRTAEPISNGTADSELDLDDLSSFFEKTASGLVQNALAGLTEEDQAQSQAETPAAVEATETPAPEATANGTTEAKPVQANGKIDLMTDYKELEALVAESTSNYVKTTLHGLSAVPYQPTVPTSTTESMAAQSPYLSHLQQHQSQHPYYTYTQPPVPEQQPPSPASSENLPPNQTFPSAILYDKARQAALSKSSAHTRREGLHSTRRPWTQEEEKALMAGLDMVKGPHWSQILTLFGLNGTISDILKDRTQVQLKDKARNLKLFFLKTNSEMPYYLQAVTGELKTRAPTQAARKEAEERARLNSEEEQAKLQGIMALAGGLQHPPQQQGRATGTAAAVAPGVVTPAQAAQAASHASHMHTAAATHHPPSTTSVSRGMVMPTPQATTQQAMQSVPQAPPRPQTQIPPQVSRPQPQLQQQQPQHQVQSQLHLPQTQTQPPHQPQQQHQQHQQQQVHHQTHQQPQQHHIQHAQPSNLPQQTTPTQNGTHAAPPLRNDLHTHHTPTPPTASTSTPSHQTQQTHNLSQSSTPFQLPQSLAPAHSDIPKATSAPEAPMSHVVTHDDDAAAEAALLEGLQAAVAQALAS
ncbi:Telomeric DNA-binding factor trf1 [Cladobotryum mycophilum]|uniref:Telomeric DNA-binding factor trf1 n=1 Tax=Cladobotryum mycophilum TaxID=491253 RepID=A0ABR0T0C6_9HYPO